MKRRARAPNQQGGLSRPPRPPFGWQNKQPSGKIDSDLGFSGERDGIRTHDPLIKSQMLYQLSYALS